MEDHYRRVHPRSKLPSGVDTEALEQAKRVLRTARKVGLSREAKLVLVTVTSLVAIVVVLAVAFQSFTPSGLAPDFTLTDTKGNSIHLRDFTGRVVLLDFMDIDCGFCQAQTSEMLIPLYSQYVGRVVFLSVDVNFVGSPDDNSRIETEFIARYGATWPHMLDVVGIYKQYGVTATPKTFILDKENKIFYSKEGYVAGDITILTQKLNEALST